MTMLDRHLIRLGRWPMTRLSLFFVRRGIHADMVTWCGFIIGICAVGLIALHYYEWALVAILLNRFADGLDGSIARMTHPTDRGAFLDISLDFLFYAAVPLGFALADPPANALAASVLIYTFVGTGCTFLAFAILAEKRELDSTCHPNKGFYYLGGLTEATETIGCFVIMCLFPEWFSLIAYVFAGLCLITIIARLGAGWYTFVD
jgi:phosphatidylglycerophosphate synthase